MGVSAGLGVAARLAVGSARRGPNPCLELEEARAVEKAADKGDHRPAKDLLMRTGVVEPLRQEGAQGPIVLVGINVHQYRDTATGQVYEADRLPEGRDLIVVATPGGPPPPDPLEDGDSTS